MFSVVKICSREVEVTVVFTIEEVIKKGLPEKSTVLLAVLKHFSWIAHCYFECMHAAVWYFLSACMSPTAPIMCLHWSGIKITYPSNITPQTMRIRVTKKLNDKIKRDRGLQFSLAVIRLPFIFRIRKTVPWHRIGLVMLGFYWLQLVIQNHNQSCN